MRVAETFKSTIFVDLDIAPSALYLLASPSTSEETQQDAMEIAERLVDAEAKLGEMLDKIPNKKRLLGKEVGWLPSSISHKQSHEVQEIARQAGLMTKRHCEKSHPRRIGTVLNIVIVFSSLINRNFDVHGLRFYTWCES